MTAMALNLGSSSVPTLSMFIWGDPNVLLNLLMVWGVKGGWKESQRPRANKDYRIISKHVKHRIRLINNTVIYQLCYNNKKKRHRGALRLNTYILCGRGECALLYSLHYLHTGLLFSHLLRATCSLDIKVIRENKLTTIIVINWLHTPHSRCSRLFQHKTPGILHKNKYFLLPKHKLLIETQVHCHSKLIPK